jgi:hypothetical protein
VDTLQEYTIIDDEKIFQPAVDWLMDQPSCMDPSPTAAPVLTRSNLQMDWSPDGLLLAVGESRSLSIWDRNSLQS